jgi:hypothetical protein
MSEFNTAQEPVEGLTNSLGTAAPSASSSHAQGATSTVAQCASAASSADDIQSDVSAVEQYWFAKPVRKFFDERDLEEFKKSGAKSDIVKFVSMCAKSVVGVKISDVKDVSVSVASVEEFMNTLHSIVDEVPPIPQPMRYGNKAYRQWNTRMIAASETFLQTFLTSVPGVTASIIELMPYLTGAFGVSGS